MAVILKVGKKAKAKVSDATMLAWRHNRWMSIIESKREINKQHYEASLLLKDNQ